MSNRRIQDERGIVWDVWDVQPGDVIAGGYDRRTGDRLREPTPESSPSVLPELEHGWLCFQSMNERRRFAPIPADWVDYPDEALRELLTTATPVTPTVRHVRPRLSSSE